MAIHNQRIGLIKEALVELLNAAKYCATTRKTSHEIWGPFATGGILGFPSALILFSIIDCIGSVLRGNKAFLIPIDGKEKMIRNTSEHIFVLNSKYFNQRLRQIDLKRIYDNIRSPLTHSSLLPKGYWLYDKDEIHNEAIKLTTDKSGNVFYCVYLIPLLELTTKAVFDFLQDLDSGRIDFENSQVNQELKKRDSNVKIDLFKEYGLDMMAVIPPTKTK